MALLLHSVSYAKNELSFKLNVHVMLFIFFRQKIHWRLKLPKLYQLQIMDHQNLFQFTITR